MLETALPGATLGLPPRRCLHLWPTLCLAVLLLSGCQFAIDLDKIPTDASLAPTFTQQLTLDLEQCFGPAERSNEPPPTDGEAHDASPADGEAHDASPADGEAHDASPEDGGAHDASPADPPALGEGCRANLDQILPSYGEVNSCLILHSGRAAEPRLRIALKWRDGQLTPIEDPPLPLSAGQTLTAQLVFLRNAGPPSLCETVDFDTLCEADCALRLTQPPIILQRPHTILNFQEADQCTTIWNPELRPEELCNGVDDNCDGLIDDAEPGVQCAGGCAHDADCPDPDRPICDRATGEDRGQCAPCHRETHAGCGADELCCGADGDPQCVPTDPEQCTACTLPDGERAGQCGHRADTCVDRQCVCGDLGEACGDLQPICAGGACIQCERHAQCPSDALCCSGQCVPTSLENCTDCYEGCSIHGANHCLNRQCACGTEASCAPDGAPYCQPESPGQTAPADYRCQECRQSADCAHRPDAPICFSGACVPCDPFTQEGCAHLPDAPICHQSTPTSPPACVSCRGDNDCQGRPDGLEYCFNGQCASCQPGTNHGCDAHAPVCEAGQCRVCEGDNECPGELLCRAGQCLPCDSQTNEGCGGDTPICFGDQICRACDTTRSGPRGMLGDAECARTDAQLICTTAGRCERCDVSDHRQCNNRSLCCGAPGHASCQPTGFDPASGGAGCASCGSFCDGPLHPNDPQGLLISDLSNQCANRQCVCGGTGGLCNTNNFELCTPGAAGGECVLCRSNADCPLDALCCGGTCVGTGFGPGAVCTSCDPVEGACTAPSASQCADRQCLCETSAECGGGKPICDPSSGGCFECLEHSHCDGHADGPYCHNRKCSPCDPNGATEDRYGCAEDGPAPICLAAPSSSALGALCGTCQRNADCHGRPGDLNYCHEGQCVLCEPSPSSHIEPGCSLHTSPVCDLADGRRSCRACAHDNDCPGASVCVTSGADAGSCQGCDPANPVSCGGQAPICDANSLICRACQHDSECGPNDICTDSGRCAPCELGSHRGCGLGALCCGSAPNQACVPLSLANCLGCGVACNSDISNHCADRAHANAAQGSCVCGASGSACAGAHAYCDGSAPGGLCVGCRDNSDCPPLSGMPYCVPHSGGPSQGGQPAYCRTCDPDVGPLSDLSGCDLLGDAPFCQRDANDVASCVRCAHDAQCEGHPAGGHCVSAGACKSCNPDHGKNNAGCDLTGAQPVCASDTFSCRGCQDNTECAATQGNGDRCHLATGACFSCADGLKNGSETGIDCGGPDCPNRCADGQSCTGASDCLSGVCTQNICRAPSCQDGIKNGLETGVDCGGPACRAAGKLCASGLACAYDADCESGLCEQGLCAIPTCQDGIKNGAETDIDCGGPDCPLCAIGQACEQPGECESKVCELKVCQAPSCTDQQQNGLERSVDCGGGACPLCLEGEKCQQGFGLRDCESGVCVNSQCAPPACDDKVKNGDEIGVDCGGHCGPCPDGEPCFDHGGCLDGHCSSDGLCGAREPLCDDGVRNGLETDIDCGGPQCPPCADSKNCVYGARDCESGHCAAGTCKPASCADQIKNGAETGIDCGGPDCLPCELGLPCTNPSDCHSKNCQDGLCAAPRCDDGVKNGLETGIDCGGGVCDPCPSGQACGSSGQNCGSGVCVAGRCAPPHCQDGVRNGQESDIDCGGPACAPCALGHQCTHDADCLSARCTQGFCQ